MMIDGKMVLAFAGGNERNAINDVEKLFVHNGGGGGGFMYVRMREK